MQLLIPKDDAINILDQRIEELFSYGFNPKVWKDRTILDLKQIFGPLGEQWLQISSIYFDTPIISQKEQKLKEGRNAAEGLLRSYIDFIDQYSKIAAQRNQIKEKGFEDKYYVLLGDYNKHSKEYMALMDEHSSLLDENENLSNQLTELGAEKEHLIKNTLQLDNVTFKRLWTGIQNLPTIQIFYIISVIVGLLGGSFALGQLIEKNRANNESFELKTENKDLKSNSQKMQTQIDNQKTIILMQVDSIKKINKIKGVVK